jgi:hypothetical protein
MSGVIVPGLFNSFNQTNLTNVHKSFFNHFAYE